MPEFAPIAQEEFVADVRAVAAMVLADPWKPDFLIGIGRGGLVPATYLSHATGIALLSIDHSSHHPGFADELLRTLAAETIAGKCLLLIDDINDSGRTIVALLSAIADAGGVRDRVRVAVLIDNIQSVARVAYRSRTVDRTIDKRWFVFPWEAMAPGATLEKDALIVPERLA